jgi:para-aminobenzoate synthetase component 1
VQTRSFPQINRQQALSWASQFPYVFFSTSNSISYPQGGFRNFLAVGFQALHFEPERSFIGQLSEQKGWLFGCLSYDLKNEIENLNSRNPTLVGFDQSCFFKPWALIEFFEEKTEISAPDSHQVFKEILQKPTTDSSYQVKPFQALTDFSNYQDRLRKIKDYIEQGEVYELNYCTAFLAEAEIEQPSELFWRLNHLSPMPFACFFKFEEKYLICASPERFLKKTGQSLLSQPIKGTRGRSPDALRDEQLKNELLMSPKERAENMMIVDLVRNDLARVSQTGSTTVQQMFGLYSFKQVHQLISSVSSISSQPLDLILRSLFPMGSMTGAPKIRAMQLIDELENFSRGYFSGAAGYLTPQADFDFNVVIRSIFYDKSQQKLGFAAGGAITYDSEPLAEYQELQTKLKAIVNALWPDSKSLR